MNDINECVEYDSCISQPYQGQSVWSHSVHTSGGSLAPCVKEHAHLPLHTLHGHIQGNIQPLREIHSIKYNTVNTCTAHSMRLIRTNNVNVSKYNCNSVYILYAIEIHLLKKEL